MFIKRMRERKEIREWKNRNNLDSVDYELAKKIAEITHMDIKKILVWFAFQKDGYTLYKFQYNRKYYQLENNKLTEITSQQIFNEE